MKLAHVLVMTLTLTFPSAFAQQKQSFGKTKDGTEVFFFTLKNMNGMEAQITNYGGVVRSLKVPDRNGHFDDVVLGFDNLADYEKPGPYFGAIIGRYANRIAGGKFKLEGKQYQVSVNDPPNMLHGGKIGFDKKVWKVVRTGAQALHLQYVSTNGEEGFPGTLTVDVTYSITDNNELKIDYLATTDRPTVLNLTNHSYFNLKGQGEGDVLNHEVEINASEFTPFDKNLIPTGKLEPVAGTPMDFRKITVIGKRIDEANPQMKLAIGYDFNYVINGGGKSLVKAARVYEPQTGRVMEVLTTEPGLQFYTGNHIEGEMNGKAGRVYKFRYGFSFEAEHYPDSPNHPNFPTTELKPGEKYTATTVYRFSTDKKK